MLSLHSFFFRHPPFSSPFFLAGRVVQRRRFVLRIYKEVFFFQVQGRRIPFLPFGGFPSYPPPLLLDVMVPSSPFGDLNGREFIFFGSSLVISSLLLLLCYG